MINRFFNNIFRISLTYLLLVTVFFAYRLTFTFAYGSSEILLDNISDLVPAFVKGVKFDTMIICYSLAIVVVFSLISSFFKSDKIQLLFASITRFWITFIAIFLCLVLMIDYQYYAFFQLHINILVFGFLDDDTAAVLKSMWTDYPVSLIVFLIVLQAIIIWKVIKLIWTKSCLPTFFSKLGSVYKWGIVMLFLLLFVYGVRGNLTRTFPLKLEDAIISENGFINKIPVNGPIALINAIKDNKKSLEKVTKEEVLRSQKYDSVKGILSDYYGIPTTKFPDSDYEKYLFKTTTKDTILEMKHYNVVFILMESLGSYYLNFHSEELNLLGEFEQHLYKDYYFRNFLSSTRGTIFSLENIMINRNWPSISKTPMRFKSFSSSVARPFYKAGYETFFISGGQIGWRNLQEFLPNQYFKQVYGKVAIMKRNKQAKQNTWGVYDEYLFDDIFNQLESNIELPKMICAMSTTNHTPYEIPDTYKPYSSIVSDSIKNMIISNKDIAEKSFMAYQYSSDCLGKFLTKLKNSPFANNTIVAVTGDHNSYTLFPYDNKGVKEIEKHRVPLYIYLPKALRKDVYKSYQYRFSSHKDIFPTLCNLTLSNQSYFSFGNNLFNDTLPDSSFYGVNLNYYVGEPTFSRSKLTKIVRARTALLEYYFAD